MLQRLRELGWIEGRTVAIEYRWADGSGERAAEIAAEFVRLKVDVIVTNGTPMILAAKKATSTIPIVFAAAGDPVGTGLVANLSKPGGNVTGLSLQATDLASKQIELLREVGPVSTGLRSSSMSAVRTPRRSCRKPRRRHPRSASPSRSWKSGARRTSRPPSRRLKELGDALFVLNDPLVIQHRARINDVGDRRQTADGVRVPGVRRQRAA